MCSPALIWQELESPSSAPQRHSCSTSQRQQRAQGRTRATAHRSGEQRLAGRQQLGGPGRFFPPDHTVPYSPLLRNPLCYEPGSRQSGRNPAFQFTSSSPLTAPGKPSPQSPERVCLAQGHTARGEGESRPARGPALCGEVTVSEVLKPPKSLGSAAPGVTKAALGPRWPSAEAGLLGVCEAGKAPPAPCTFSAGSRLRRLWLASLGLLLLLPMVLAGDDRRPRGRGKPLGADKDPPHPLGKWGN